MPLNPRQSNRRDEFYLIRAFGLLRGTRISAPCGIELHQQISLKYGG